MTSRGQSVLPALWNSTSNNAETLSALRSKHPAPHPNSLMPPPFPPAQLQGQQVSCKEVVGAIQSLLCGPAGGPDGLSPQHLKDMVCSSAGGGVSCLLRALTAFINLALKGKTAHFACPFLFGASLIALEKTGRGVRPIPVGCTLRRLAAKCAGY